MANAGNGGPAQSILDAIGGPENIKSMTHCATRLRFELNDGGIVDKDKLDRTPEVLGALPQSGDRYQVVIGGGVADMYNKIRALPSMAGAVEARTVVKEKEPSDADVKAAVRSKGKGKRAWMNNFFEYLSDSFRPILGVLLGASLIMAIISIMDATGVQKASDPNKGATWVFLDAMAQSVFYFLPLMVAYNASKKLKVDGWIGFTIMAAVMTPQFLLLRDTNRFPDTTCITNEALGTQACTAHVFGLPMLLNDYKGQVFVPLIMAAVLALVYHGFKKIVSANLQMVFVPFLSMIIMIPVTAFLIGPAGIFIANYLGVGLATLNNWPIIFSILIPLLFPVLVPLGLHWPLNALMLVNIQTLGYDFIQGPMGAWNFACFGATAGVLLISIRQRDKQMRQVATGALAAGLLGGISEPSLYGIHLRFLKRIYPPMLVGCFTGGLIIGLSGGVKTTAFAFSSLLTIPVFKPMGVYVIGIVAAFFVSMILVSIFGFRTPEQKAEFIAKRDAEEAAARDEAKAPVAAAAVAAPAAAAAGASAPATVGGPAAAASQTGTGVVTTVLSPADGELVALSTVNDPVFSTGVLGDGVGVVPSDGSIRVPLSGTAMTVASTGHAFGIKSDDGVEILVHVGIDTVKMNGEGFDVHVQKGQRLEAGDPLVDVDLDAVKAAGYDTTVILAVTNTKAMTEVTPEEPGKVEAGDPAISVVH